MAMSGYEEFLKSEGAGLKGPVALIISEDEVEIATTIRHHSFCGFKTMIVLHPEAVVIEASLQKRARCFAYPTRAEAVTEHVVNALIAAVPAGTWLYYCYNAEYLFYPFAETRRVSEMLEFHQGERRDAMLTYVVDVYAGDLNDAPNAVSLEDAHLDRTGYYALGRDETDRPGHPADRQLNFFGGLRWRFEEHVPEDRRKIDRISLFRAKPGLKLRGDHTLNDEEMNTYACPWHHNLTAAICSFRTAKALRTNPGSKFDINSFRWHNSTEFEWHSQQLMDLGLMEPGQWF